VNIKIRVCQSIGPAAAGSAGPVPTALPMETGMNALWLSYVIYNCVSTLPDKTKTT